MPKFPRPGCAGKSGHKCAIKPPAVAPLARNRCAPCLFELFCGSGWETRLDAARRELRKFRETTPALGLPAGSEPAAFKWLVRDRHVMIFGRLDRVRLVRLLASLLRDGAFCAAGLDTTGMLHTAYLPMMEEAA